MKATSLELWQMIRSKIQHEESWIQQSISWHFASTAFLFSAYAVLVVATRNQGATVPLLASVLLVTIPVLGASFSISVYIGILIAGREIGQALHEWQTLGPKEAARRKLPAVHLVPTSLRLARFNNSSISIIAIMMWLILLALSIATVAGIIPALPR